MPMGSGGGGGKLNERSPTLLEGLQEVYKRKIYPLERAFKFDVFYTPLLSENEIKAKPLVLLLGQYSTGKTTFIQSILGRDYPGGRIGPEPTTDRFVAVMHGNQDRLIPGNAATIQMDKPFGGLVKFGSNFLSKFQVSETISSILESCSFIDTPGVLSGDKQRLGRSYDFPQICQWFAEHSDMILVFFDAHKLDISDELKEVLEILKPYDDKIRIVLNKADQVGRQELMRVYGALMWSLGKVIQVPEVPRVFIGSFNNGNGNGNSNNNSNDTDNDNDKNVDENNSGLLKDEKVELLAELRRLPINSSTRKINDLVKRARLARVHAIIINQLQSQMPRLFGRSVKQSKLLLNLANEFTQVQQEYRIPIGDFPDIERFTENLKDMNLCAFPKLQSKQLIAIEEAITIDIPFLMQKFPPAFGSIRSLGIQNPFTNSSMSIQDLGEDVWKWSNINHSAYNSIFETLKPIDGKIDGSVCRDFLLQSGLGAEELRNIWTISDYDHDGKLDINEFSIIMHLINMRIQGVVIPNLLPESLMPLNK